MSYGALNLCITKYMVSASAVLGSKSRSCCCCGALRWPQDAGGCQPCGCRSVVLFCSDLLPRPGFRVLVQELSLHSLDSDGIPVGVICSSCESGCHS